jgi:protein-S-isoprenylcysteine O-methyltransferase Ste14
MSVQVNPPVPPQAPPRWAVFLRALANSFVFDFPGGPKVLKAAWVINLQKGGTLPFLLSLLWLYDNGAPAAWLYVAMHGGYGLIWLVKASAFPDPSLEARVTYGGATNMFLGVLGWYWVMGWLLISSDATPAYPLPAGAWFCLCVSLCLVGSAVMIAADAQKFFTLRERPGLIADGMFRFIRHPNYLGEMLIYFSFALMVWQAMAFAILAWVWLFLFAPNIAMKEASLSRHPGWPDYKRRSWRLIPGLF